MTQDHEARTNNLSEAISNNELKNSVLEAAEKIKKLSEDLRGRIQTVHDDAQGKALDLLQQVENLSEKLHVKTDVEDNAFQLLMSMEALSERLQGYAENFEAKLGEGQVQFHLGLMEAMGKWEGIKHQANEILGSSRSEVNKAWHNVSEQSVVAVKNMNQSIGEIIHRFV